MKSPKIGILVDDRRRPLYQSGLVERLKRAFGKMGAVAETFDFGKTNQDIDLVRIFDAVYPLPVVPSRALASIEFIDDFPWLINSIKVQIRSLDKRRTVAALDQAGVPYPKTLDTRKAGEVSSFVKRHSLAIIKSTDQVAGLGHYVVEVQDDELFCWVPNIARHRQLGIPTKGDQPAGWRVPLQLIEPGSSKRAEESSECGNRPCPAAYGPFLVQRLVGAHLPERMRDRIYRLYVVGGEPVFGSARVMGQSEPGDLSYAIVNYSWGGEYELFPIAELPSELVEIGHAAAKVLGFDIGAIDLIEDEDGRWLVLEGETDNFIYHLCRGFRSAHSYRERFDLDLFAARYVVDCLANDREPPRRAHDKDDIRAMFKLLSGAEAPGSPT